MFLHKLLIDFDNNIRPYKFNLNFEDGTAISFSFRRDHLKHLLGLQYTSHSSLPANLLHHKIKKKKITLQSLQNEKNYSEIEDRILNFSSLKYLLDPSNCKQVILFDNSKLANCKLNSKYILFDSKTNMTLHLGLAQDSDVYYPETWIIESKKHDRYIAGQTIIPVSLSIEIK